MPISTPTQLGQGGSAVTPSSITTDSVDPSANALILAFCHVHAASGAQTFSGFSSTFATGGWTTVAGAAADYGTGNVRSIVGWAIATSSPGSGTATATFGGLVDALKIELIQIESGFSSVAPILQAKNIGAASVSTGADLTGSLDAAPASTSMLISGVCSAPNNVDHDVLASWTLISEDFGESIPSIFSYRTGTTETGFGATVLFADQTSGAAGCCVEVQEPTVAAPSWDSARIGPEGGWLTVSASEAVEFGEGGATGVVIHSTEQGDLTASYRASASTATAPVFALPQGRTIGKNDVVTYSYTNPGDGWESTAGDDVETFSATAVTNQSTKLAPHNLLALQRRRGTLIRM